MERIAVPVDFGPATQAVTRYAALIARALGCELELIYVHKIIDDHRFDELTAEAEAAIDARLSKLADTIIEAANSHLRIVQTTSRKPVNEAIVEAADDCDLIVMGQTESRGIWRFMLGDTTGEVVAKADCPVLIVPAGSSPELPKTLALALDRPLGNDRYSIPFVHLAKRLGAEVDVFALGNSKGDEIINELLDIGCPLREGSMKEGAPEEVPDMLTVSKEHLDDTWLCLAHYPRHNVWRSLFASLNDRLAAIAPIPTLMLTDVSEEKLANYGVATSETQFNN